MPYEICGGVTVGHLEHKVTQYHQSRYAMPYKFGLHLEPKVVISVALYYQWADKKGVEYIDLKNDGGSRPY